MTTRTSGFVRALVAALALGSLSGAGCGDSAGVSADGGEVRPDQDAAAPTDAGPGADAAGEPDAGRPELDAGRNPDAGRDPDAGPLPDAGPSTCGNTGMSCASPKAICFNGQCVACTDPSHCAPGQTCDSASLECATPSPSLAPFALSCASLPANGACQGGPREVLLVTERTGLVLMLDPADGHYLGVFKRSAPAFNGTYWLTSQGSDQCIWTSGDTNKGVERFNVDGTFKDVILPPKRYYEGQDDLIQDPHSFAFTAQHVYVASSAGTPHDRVVRFKISSLAAGAQAEYEIVLNNESQLDSLLVLGDQTLVIANKTSDRVERLSADGTSVTPVLGEVSKYGQSQVSYGGDSHVLVADNDSSTMFRVALDSMLTQTIKPYDKESDDYYSPYGAALLGNGKWLFTTRGDIRALDPASSNPAGQSESLFDDAAINLLQFKHVGRACLPSAFVDSRHPTQQPPVASCDEPDGTPLFAENFESGAFTGSGQNRNFNGFYERAQAGVTVSIDGALGADGSARSLHIVSAPTSDEGVPLGFDAPSGVAHALSSLKPSYIGYYTRSTGDWLGGYFALNEPVFTAIDMIYGDEDHITTFRSRVASKLPLDTWARVQLRDINWESRSYDLYVNCVRVANDIQFSEDSGTSLTTLDLFNLYPENEAWFDQIVMK